MENKLIKILEIIESKLGETNNYSNFNKERYIDNYRLFNTIDNIYRSDDFAINYDDSSKKFNLYTVYSNREITFEWIDKALEMRAIVENINSILGAGDDE